MQQVLTEMCGETDRAAEVGLMAPVATDVCLVDTTCLEANIHFPVDWVLLRDVALTLLKATKLIRTAGLRERMQHEPAGFATAMNRLCIAMTHSRRQKDSRRARKRVLRQFKPLLRRLPTWRLRRAGAQSITGRWGFFQESAHPLKDSLVPACFKGAVPAVLPIQPHDNYASRAPRESNDLFPHSPSSIAAPKLQGNSTRLAHVVVFAHRCLRGACGTLAPQRN